MQKGADKTDIVIAYRVCPILSQNAPEMDKYYLTEKCLKSFLQSLRGINFKLYALLDGCPVEYETLFKDLIHEEQLNIIKYDGVGNAKTFLEQIKILSEQNESDIVYFAEDDYFYFDSFSEMLNLIKNQDIDFITPYDAPFQNHSYNSKIIFEKRHWRTVASTACTFMSKKNTLLDTQQYFRLYPILNDYGVWMLLTKFRLPQYIFWLIKEKKFYALLIILQHLNLLKTYNIYSPIPGIAVHIIKEEKFRIVTKI